jgi:hypothetical protein
MDVVGVLIEAVNQTPTREVRVAQDERDVSSSQFIFDDRALADATSATEEKPGVPTGGHATNAIPHELVLGVQLTQVKTVSG